MRISEEFERVRDDLRSRLSLCRTLEESCAAAEKAIEGIAANLAKNESSAADRQKAGAVLALCKNAPRLIYSCTARGELVLNQSKESFTGKAVSKLPLAGLGILLCVAAFEFLSGRIIPAVLTLIGAGLAAGSKGLLALTPAAEARGIPVCEADKMTAALADLCRAADVCLLDLDTIEKENALRLESRADEALLSYFGELLEAEASGRQDLAQRSLEGAKDYLSVLGIESLDYNDKNAVYFDVLPTLGEEKTLRPALLKDGRLLRRGVAVCR